MTFSSEIKSLKKIPSGLLMSASKRIESFYLNGDAIQDCKKKENIQWGMNGLQSLLPICSNKFKLEFQTKKAGTLLLYYSSDLVLFRLKVCVKMELQFINSMIATF